MKIALKYNDIFILKDIMESPIYSINQVLVVVHK